MSAQAIDYSQVLGETDSVLCYNPSPKALEKDCDGNTYVFCPEACSNPDHSHPAPGVTPVTGKAKVYSKGKKVDKVFKMTAREVATFLCGEDGRSGPLGKAGLRPLTGNAEVDELVKADAYQSWREKRYHDARNVVRSHEAACALAKTDPNFLTPVITPAIDEAYQILLEEKRAGNVPLATHPCDACNAPFYNEHELSVHKRDSHGQVQSQDNSSAMLALVQMQAEQNRALAAQMAELTSKLAALEAKKKPGRKPKAQAE